MVVKNKYKGRCGKCARPVEAGAGIASNVGGWWVTFHESCAPAQKAQEHPYVATASTQSGEVAFYFAGGRSDRDAWDRAKRIISGGGGRWNRVTGPGSRDIASAKDAIKIVLALQEAGWEVKASDEGVGALIAKGADVLKHEAEAHNGAIEAVEARLAGIQKKLAERGQRLRRYQEEGVLWLAPRKGAIMGDEMGLGKTAQTLCSLPEADSVGAVVVCPAVAKGVWKREIGKWRPEFKPVVLKGRGSFRWPKHGEIIITNYDILPPPDSVSSPPMGTVVIADEAHALKERDAKRTQSFAAMAKACRDSGGRSWLLTATPMLNRPFELWGLCSVAGVEREVFGDRPWAQFLYLFEGYKGPWGGYEFGVPKKETGDHLKKGILRRIKADVARDIPSLTRVLRTVELTPEGRAACDELARAMEGLSDEELLKATASFEKLSAIRAAIARSKVPALSEIVQEYQEAGEPLVVMSMHREPIDSLAAMEGWGKITGEESAEQKSAVEEAFQRGDLRGVACTITAAGVAITLTRASNVVFLDEAWTPALNEQAAARVHRIGQTKPVTVTVLVGDHLVEERVAQVIGDKMEKIAASVGNATIKEGEASLPQRAGEVYVPMISLAPTPSDQATTSNTKPKHVKLAREVVRVTLEGRREAASPAEEFAIGALYQLLGDDVDEAKELNGIGFSKSTGPIGRQILARYEVCGSKLTDEEWREAVGLARHHHRQVGKLPGEAA